jgi:protein-disulfide isomerase
MAAPAAIPSLAAADGSPIRNSPAPDTRRLLEAPWLLSVGSKDPDVTIVELFDYNCGYCKRAAAGIDELLQSDSRVRLALVNNPILSAESTRAAEAQAAVLALYGPEPAYQLHQSLLQSRGQVDERRAFEIAQFMGLDRARIAKAMTDPKVISYVQDQKLFASEGHLRITPTFIMAQVAFIGWPGVPTMFRFVAAARRCGSLQCGGTGQN